jgi:hypothetical protein
MSRSADRTDRLPEGPWRVSGFEISADGDNRMVMGADGFAVAYISGRSRAEHEAIATLIAASPCMYEALDGFVKQWEACGPNSDFGRYFEPVYQPARAALARARGDTP